MKSTSNNRSRVFIDTSGWIELLLKTETHHKAVVDYFKRERQKNTMMYTSDYVLDEAWTRLLTQGHVQECKQLKTSILEAVTDHSLTLIHIDEKLFEKSWINFEKFSAIGLSFTDATIISCVRDYKIDEILTLDGGFVKAGSVIKPYPKGI